MELNFNPLISLRSVHNLNQSVANLDRTKYLVTISFHRQSREGTWIVGFLDSVIHSDELLEIANGIVMKEAFTNMPYTTIENDFTLGSPFQFFQKGEPHFSLLLTLSANQPKEVLKYFQFISNQKDNNASTAWCCFLENREGST